MENYESSPSPSHIPLKIYTTEGGQTELKVEIPSLQAETLADVLTIVGNSCVD